MSQTRRPYIRSALEGLSPYAPGEQPPAEAGLIKLNTNENPYPPSPRALEALQNYNFDLLRLYSDPGSDRLRQAAADLWKVPVEQLIVGNGSDEILAMVLRAFLEPGGIVAYPIPTYSLYPILARVYGGIVEERPAELGGSKVQPVLDVAASVTFIASPNSPDGALVSREDIENLCEARKENGVVVVDEAYVDFSEGGCLDLALQHENLVVSRTLSKSFSLAGLRVGIAIAGEALVQALWTVKDSYNLGTLPQILGTAALEDLEWMRANAQKIIETREWTTRSLEERGWRVYPSQANFIFAEPKSAKSAESIFLELKRRKIHVRYFDAAPLDRGLRISIGSPQEMESLIEALDDMENT